MKKTILLVMLAFIGLSTTNAQVGIGIASPDASAILDIDVTVLPASAKRGFLPPRLNNTQRDNITDLPEGLVIYNTTLKEIQVYDGAAWKSMYFNCKVSAPIAGVVAQSVRANRTEPGAINDGQVVAAEGTALSLTSHYMVLDLGKVYQSGSFVTFDVWSSDPSSDREVRTSTVPLGSYISGGGSDPQLNDVTNNNNLRFDAYTYTLQTASRYVQVEVTISNGGGVTEFVEAPITEFCM